METPYQQFGDSGLWVQRIDPPMLRACHLPVSIREAGLGWIELELRMIQDQTQG